MKSNGVTLQNDFPGVSMSTSPDNHCHPLGNAHGIVTGYLRVSRQWREFLVIFNFNDRNACVERLIWFIWYDRTGLNVQDRPSNQPCTHDAEMQNIELKALLAEPTTIIL